MDALAGFAALMGLFGLIAAWIGLAAGEQFILEGAMAGARRVLRAPLYLVDQAAAFWLFALSPAYRRQQVAILSVTAGRGRRMAVLHAAFSAVCGLGIGVLLLSAVL